MLTKQERTLLIEYIEELCRRYSSPLLLSVVGNDMMTNDRQELIRLKDRSGGLISLLRELEPEVILDMDEKGANRLQLVGIPQTEPMAAEKQGYPIHLDPEDPMLQAQIHRMHEFAFMGWWNNVYRQLKNLTGFSGNDPSMWTAIIGRQMAAALMRNELVYRDLEAEDGSVGMCLFKTGLRTPDGHSIIAVFRPNPYEAQQKWVLAEYSYPGNPNGIYGTWLIEVFGEGDLKQIRAQQRMLVRRALERSYESFRRVEPTLARLSRGYLPMGEELQQVTDYIELAKQLVDLTTRYRDQSFDPARTALEEAMERIGSVGLLNAIGKLNTALEKVLEEVQTLLRGMLSQNTTDDAHPVARCRSFMQSAVKGIDNGTEPEQYLIEYKEWLDRFDHLAQAIWSGNKKYDQEVATVFNITAQLQSVLAETQKGKNPGVFQLITEAQEAMRALEASVAEAQAYDEEEPSATDDTDETTSKPDEPSFDDVPDSTPSSSVFGGEIPGGFENVSPVVATILGEMAGSVPQLNAIPVTPEPPVQELIDAVADNDGGDPEQDAPRSVVTPGKKEPAAGRKRTDTTRPVLEAALDEQLRRCETGELTAEMEPLMFGSLQLRLDGAAEAGNVQATARELLYDPEGRTVQALICCIRDVLGRKRTRTAEALIALLPKALWQTAYYSFMAQLQDRLMTPTSALPEDIEGMCELLGELLDRLNKTQIDASERKVVVDAIAALAPHLIGTAFRRGEVEHLLKVLAVLGNGNERLIAHIRKLEACLGSENADREFMSYRNKTEMLYAVKEAEHAAEELVRLKKKGEELFERFQQNGIGYTNAMLTVRAMATDRSRRTYLLFRSLEAGTVLEGAEPFEDADDMMDHANELMRSIISNSRGRDPIVAGARNSVIGLMTELNEAFLRLQVIGELHRMEGQCIDWYRRVIRILREWARDLATHMPLSEQDPFAGYLYRVANGQVLETITDDHRRDEELAYRSENTDPWPIDDGDRGICALIELSGELKALRCRDFDIGSVPKERMDELRARLNELIDWAVRLNGQLNDMRWFNIIEIEEFEALQRIVACSYGWLSALRREAARGDLYLTMPVVRYELELRYLDARLDRLLSAVGASALEAVDSCSSRSDGDAYEALRHEIESAVARRDIRHIADRFSDAVSSVATIRAEENEADAFFERCMLDALSGAIKFENWKEWRLQPLMVEGHESRRKNQSEKEEVHMLGRVCEIAKKSESLDEQKTLRMQEMFSFLGFGAPVLSMIGDRLNLTVSTPARSVCPIPALGLGIAMRDPGQNGRWCVNYTVRIMHSVREISTVFTNEEAKADPRVTILFCPFVIGFEERRSLIEAARRSGTRQRAIFLLDKCFLRYAMCIPATDRLKAFYRCTSLLSRLNPYTVATELQWEGTFFGREDEIGRVLQESGGYTLYGGRRLGKTSIMREAEYRWLTTDLDHIALYLNLQTLSNPDLLWYRVAEKLRAEIPELEGVAGESVAGDAHIAADANRIINTIAGYLRGKGKYLLLLLDECDELVYRDTIRNASLQEEARYSRLGEIVKLMDESDRRCKVVLAGLDRVTRFIRNISAFNMTIPNNYIAYQRFTESICVRPLLGNDMQNAYDLIDVPFKLMGYRLDRESVLYILRVCCFRPNLIQKFCEILLNAIRVREAVEFRTDSLYLEVPCELVRRLQEGKNPTNDLHDGQKEQSITIPLNVGETAVYAPVAYAVALLTQRDPMRGMFTGFGVEDIRSLINNTDPGFAGGLPRASEYLATILQELVAMGVLRSIVGPDTMTYALFSSYMLRMLGTEAEIRELFEASLRTHIERSRGATENIARKEMFLEHIWDKNGFVYPLNNGQLSKLSESLKRSGYAVIVGSSMLRIDDVKHMATGLRLRNDAGTCTVSLRLDRARGPEQLAEQLSGVPRQEDHTMLVLVYRGWDNETIRWIREQRIEGRYFILLADQDMCWAEPELIEGIPDQDRILLSRMARSYRMFWFRMLSRRQDFRFGEDVTRLAHCSDRVGAVTGDWPELLLRFGSLMESNKDAALDDLLDEFERLVFREQREETIRQLGIDRIPESVLEALNFVRDEEEIEDLLSVCGDGQQLLSTLRSLMLLGIAEVSDGDDLARCRITRLDPVAAKLLWGGDER